MPALPDEMPPEPAPDLPTEEPAPGKPSEVEDLFKDTAPTPPEPEQPAEPEKKSDDLEDLFKDSDEKKGASATLPEGLEDLFGDPPATVATRVPAPTAAKAAVQASEPAAAPIAAAQVNRDGMRLWTDNTGNYRVTARLVSVTKTHVRLLKDTGKYTTVSFERLSRADLAFVFSQPAASIASSR
jgi:hypothetical protein